MSLQEATSILTKEQIGQKINRLAYQVYEENFDEKEVIVCGIADRGYLLASLICAKLQEIASFKVELVKITVNKKDPAGKAPVMSPVPSQMDNKTVILCDDVLYTGKTMAYAAMPFISAGVKKLQCLVLVHRHHLNFPIQPTFIGLSLATTIQEHVRVDFSAGVSLE